MKLITIVILLLILQSCSATNKEINYSPNFDYQEVEINEIVYLTRVSDLSKLDSINSDCTSETGQNFTGDSITSRSRAILARGLKFSHMRKFIESEFFLNCKLVINKKVKTVLSTIVDTDLKLSNKQKNEILRMLLQTEHSIGTHDFECMEYNISSNEIK